MRSVLATTIVLGALTQPAIAQPAKGEPDWPCTQSYNPDLVLGHVWSAPDPTTVGGHWAADPAIAPLVSRLSSTVLPLDQALAELDAFIETVRAEERPRRLPLLVAGLHEAFDAERKKVIAAIHKLGRNQKQLAQGIRERNDRIRALRASAEGAAEATALEETLQWDLKIFQDRRSTVSLVCAQPDMIEKRLFAMAKRIEAALPAGSPG